MNTEGSLIGLQKFAPFIAHSIGDVDSFQQFADHKTVAVHVVPPGYFKRSWFEGHLKDREVKGFEMKPTFWRVVICGVHADLLDNVLARANKLEAMVYLQNGTHLRAVEDHIRETAARIASVIILLNKPVNKGKRELTP
jgi:hypothetical protein